MVTVTFDTSVANDLRASNISSALIQHVLEISNAERKSKIVPDRVLDDLNRKTMAAIAEVTHRSLMAQGLDTRSRRDSSIEPH